MKKYQDLTPTQKKKRLSKIKTGLFAGEFLSVITPFFIIGAVNYNKYFVEYDGTKMSLACVLATVVMGVAVWLVSSKKFKGSFISLIIGWYVVAFIFFLLGTIINDIAVIMFIGGSGIVGAYGLDFANIKVGAKIEELKTAMKSAESEMTKDAYKEELKESEEKKVKIKVVKK